MDLNLIEMKQTNDKCFIDTNILLYCYAKYESEKKSIARHVTEISNTVIRNQVLSEVSNVLNKKHNFNWDFIELILLDIMSDHLFEINRTNTIVQTCTIANRNKYSFYDSCIIAATLKRNCSILFSEDMQ